EVDLRLRPTIQIENESIDSYYRNVFLEELRKAGLPPVPLPEVSGRIREILTQEKINEAFTTWLQSLRKDSKIRTLLPLDNQSSAGGAAKWLRSPSSPLSCAAVAGSSTCCLPSPDSCWWRSQGFS